MAANRAAHRQPASKDPAELGVVSDGTDLPEPRDTWLDSTRAEFDKWVGHDLARHVTETDHAGFLRMFDLMDRITRADDASSGEWVVEGSQGQPVLNPLVKQADSWRAEVRQLEDRFGGNPKARLNLGIKLGEAARSIDEMNRRMAEAHASDSDPRLSVIEGEARQA